jgi:hypothetical protein
MTTRIEEGRLAFEFGDNWQVFKLDDHRDYREKIEKVDDTKAVDILGILHETDLYFIEVKDFRGYRIENKDRLKDGVLAIEIAQKVRDSLSCIISAHRTSSDREYWRPFARHLCSPDTTVKVVIWLEDDPAPAHLQSRRKARASISSKVFRQKLSWLTRRVLVCGSDKAHLPDVTIYHLPHD